MDAAGRCGGHAVCGGAGRRPAHGRLHLAAPPRLAELVLLGVVLGAGERLLLDAVELARREARAALEGPRVAVGDAADLAQLVVGELGAVQDDVGLLVAQVVEDAVVVGVVAARLLARRVADGLQLVPLEELLRVEAGRAGAPQRLGVGAAARLADGLALHVLGEDVAAARLGRVLEEVARGRTGDAAIRFGIDAGDLEGTFMHEGMPDVLAVNGLRRLAAGCES